MRGIHRSPVNSPHKGQLCGALMFSLIWALNKRLSKQSWGWWFGTPSRSLWRHCNAKMNNPDADINTMQNDNDNDINNYLNMSLLIILTQTLDIGIQHHSVECDIWFVLSWTTKWCSSMIRVYQWYRLLRHKYAYDLKYTDYPFRHKPLFRAHTHCLVKKNLWWVIEIIVAKRRQWRTF